MSQASAKTAKHRIGTALIGLGVLLFFVRWPFYPLVHCVPVDSVSMKCIVTTAIFGTWPASYLLIGNILSDVIFFLGLLLLDRPRRTLTERYRFSFQKFSRLLFLGAIITVILMDCITNI